VIFPIAPRLVVDHLDHLAMIDLHLVQHHRLREAGDDGRRIVDLVRHAAHQLAQRGEPLGLLQLAFGAALVGDVAANASTRATVLPSRIGEYSMAVMPWVPSSRR